MSDQSAQPTPGAPDQGGQGAAGSGDPSELFRPYVADVPQELHPLVIDALQKQNGDFTKRFQEAADFRKTWEPYSSVEGLNEVEPEELQGLLTIRGVLHDPEAATQFVAQNFEGLVQNGYMPEISEETWAKVGEENGWIEGDDGEGDEPQAGGEDMKALIAQAVQEALGPIQQHFQETQSQQEQRELSERFNQRFDELVAQHELLPKDASPEDQAKLRSQIVQLGMTKVQTSDDPVGEAVEMYLEMTGRAKADAFDQKLSRQNGSTLQAGTADTRPQEPSWLNGGPSPRDLALQRLRPS
jgi:hypothetical protein